MPSLKDMRGQAKEAGLMKLDRLITTRQRIPNCGIPIPIRELCERYEKLYTGCINDVMRELTLLDQNLPSDIMPLRDEMTLCGEAGYGALRHVQVHLHAILLRHVADLLRLKNSSSRENVWMDDGQRA